MRYPDHLKEDIRGRIDIADFISRYVPLKKAGTSFKGLCPFHQEKTPSFTVTPAKSIFHCFGCGKGGDVFSFLMEAEHLGFMEAFELLAKEAGIDLSKYALTRGEKREDTDPVVEANRFALEFFHGALYKSKKASDYFARRGMTEETIKLFKFGYAPEGWDNLLRAAAIKEIGPQNLLKAGLATSPEGKGPYDRFRDRVIFPIYSLSGLPIAFGGRAFAEGEGIAKYINSPETPLYHKSSVLYGLHVSRPAIREANAAILVEGYMDFHMLFQAGIKNLVATSGTALTPDQARMIRRYAEKCFVMFDGDNAGVSASSRGMEILAQAGLEVRVAVLPAKHDPDSFVREFGADALQKIIGAAQTFVEYKLRTAEEKHGTASPEAKGKIVADVAQSLAAIADDVVRLQYAEQINRKMRLPPGTVEKAMASGKKKALYPIRSAFVQPSETSGETYAMERTILGILIAHPHLAEDPKTRMLEENTGIWAHPAWEKFFMKLLNLIRSSQSGVPDFARKMDDFPQKQKEFIAAVVAGEDAQFSATRWNRAITRIVVRFWSRKMSELRELMSQEGSDRLALQKEINQIALNVRTLEKEIVFEDDPGKQNEKAKNQEINPISASDSFPDGNQE